MGALTDPKILYQEVSRILNLDRKDAAKLIGRTTTTAYRRVHEIISSVLDRIVSGQLDETILIDLSKVVTLVSYQSARGQLSEGLASNLSQIINEVQKYVQNYLSQKRDLDLVKKVASSARALLDALAVLVYEYGR